MTAEIKMLPTQEQPYARIAVIGGGAWGTALASVAAKAGRAVQLYARDRATVRSINSSHVNARYLPEIALPPSLTATDNLEVALNGADAVLLVVPSGAVRAMASRISGLVKHGTPVAICTKGIEPTTGYLMSQVVSEEMPHVPVG